MQPPDEQFIVSTPELVEFGYEVAGVGSRFIAALLDTVIIAVLYLLLVLGGLALSALPALVNQQGSGLSYFALGVLTIIQFVLLWGYYVFFETIWNGQTPGKRLTDLRVVRDSGGPISFWEALIRNLVRVVDFLPLAYGVGVLTMFVNGRARRLGDFAAGTLVVHEGGAVSLDQLLTRTTVAATAPPDSPLAADLDMRRLTAADLYLAREVLARQATLQPAAAWSLCLRATQVIATRAGLQGNIHDPRAFLAEVLRLADRRATPEPAASPGLMDAPDSTFTSPRPAV
jgi:uncharacterized RDD family membrane protein YckC